MVSVEMDSKEGWLGEDPLCGGKSFLGAGGSAMEMDSEWAVFEQSWPQGRHWVLGTEGASENRENFRQVGC